MGSPEDSFRHNAAPVKSFNLPYEISQYLNSLMTFRRSSAPQLAFLIINLQQAKNISEARDLVTTAKNERIITEPDLEKIESYLREMESQEKIPKIKELVAAEKFDEAKALAETLSEKKLRDHLLIAIETMRNRKK